jgi:hypothetical protein
MMWKKNFLIIVSLLAWGSLVAHDYIPHHHHSNCLSSHEVHHHHSDELGEHHHDHHDISCHVNSFFDKKSNQTAIAPQAQHCCSYKVAAKRITTPFLRNLFVKPDILPHCLRGPPSFLS